MVGKDLVKFKRLSGATVTVVGSSVDDRISLLVLLLMSAHGMVIGAAEPLIEGMTVVRLTGTKSVVAETPDTKLSAGEIVTSLAGDTVVKSRVISGDLEETSDSVCNGSVLVIGPGDAELCTAGSIPERGFTGALVATSGIDSFCLNSVGVEASVVDV